MLWLGAAMIGGGFVLAALEVWAKVSIASTGPGVLEDDKLAWWQDLLKTAMTGPVPNVLIVLGFILVLIDADVITLAIGGE